MSSITRFEAIDQKTGESIASYFQWSDTVECEVLTEALVDLEHKRAEPVGQFRVWNKEPRALESLAITKALDLGKVSTLLADVEEETFSRIGSEGEETGGQYEFLDEIIEHLDFCESYPRVDSTQVVIRTEVLTIE